MCRRPKAGRAHSNPTSCDGRPVHVQDVGSESHPDRPPVDDTAFISGSLDEVWNVVLLSYQDYEYRHKTYWNLVFRAVFAIATLMTIPYLFDVSAYYASYLPVFPIASVVLSAFSVLVLKAEGVRMAAIRKRMNVLLEGLSTAYKEIDISFFEGGRLLRWTNRFSIANLILCMFFVLFVGGVCESILVLSGNFSPS